MIRHTLKRAALCIPIAASLLIASACSGGGDDDGANTDAKGGTFVMAASGVPGQLDSWTTYEGDSSRTQQYEWASTLVQYDASDLPEKGCSALATSADLRPNLAESWEYNADKTQLVFTLRPGVKSPAGNEMNAEDVVWSLQRALKQSTLTKFLMNDVASFQEKDTFEAIGDMQVAINLKKATALDVTVFTYPLLGVQDSREIKKQAGASDPEGLTWLKTHTADFGPWKLDKFTPNTEAVYTANPNYWDKSKRGNVDRLVIRSVPDAGTRLQLLETGEVHYAERLAFDQYKKLEGNDKTDLVNCASPNRDTLLLNQGFEPFADVNVRKAISEAIDRDALVEGVYKGLADPSTTGVSDVYWKPTADAKKITFDAKNAKALLAAAGVTDLKFAIVASPTRPGAYAQSLAVQIQSMLKEVGVNASIEVVPGATEFSDTFFKSNYEAMVYLEPPAIGDPFYSTALYSSSRSFQNTFKYSNADYNAGVDKLLVTQPGPERDAIIKEVSDIVVDTVPQVYLTDARYLHAFSSKISGYENTPHGQLFTYRMTKK